jgi:capsid protein
MNFFAKLLRWVFARYEGATFSTRRSTIWSAVQSARFDATCSTRMELVRKSRYFEKNNAIVNRLADIFECYTVGQGLQLSPATGSPEWNAKAKQSWDGWARYADLTSLQSFGCLQSLIARTWFVDGEVFILLTKGESGAPRLQLIEGHRVQTPPTLAKQEGVSVVDGVQIDKTGRPMGYYIGEEDARGRLMFGAPTPSASVIHVFEPGRPGQYRGLPFGSSVINELHDLDDLHILEMTAAKDAGKVTNVITNAAGEVDPTTMRRIRMSQGVTTNTGAAATETSDAYYEQSIGAGTVVMKTGDGLQQFRSERPSVVTRDYWRYKTELVCTGYGIPYVLVFPDSMQGTVYRGALDMAASFFRARASVMADVCRRIYEWRALWAKANEPFLRDAPGDWKAVAIQLPRAVNVDVGRNSAAMLQELTMGATNWANIYGPLGLDWRVELRAKAEQAKFVHDLAAEYGIDPGEIANLGTAATNSQQTDPNQPVDPTMPMPAAVPAY